MLGYLFLTSRTSFLMSSFGGTLARSILIPCLKTTPFTASTRKFHFSFQVISFDNLLRVICMSWSINAIFASTFCAAFAAVNISVPGDTPTFAPSDFSAHAPIIANSHPFTPMCLMSDSLVLLFWLRSAANLPLSSSMATIVGFFSRIFSSTLRTLSGDMWLVPMICSFAMVSVSLFLCLLIL